VSSPGVFATARVVWSAGMLVSPQHLQQQTSFLERLIDTRLQTLTPYDWGVLHVEIDPNALASDQLVVESFAGVLPEGTPLAFGKGQQGAPAPRAIGKAFPPTQKALQVYLGIAREREGIANVGDVNGQSQRVRFALASREVADLTSGREGRVLVSFGRPNVVVLFGNEANEDYDSLQIAEIVHDGAGGLQLSDTFIPPCLQLGASPIIMSGLKRIFALVVARQRALSETCRERSSSTLEFQSSDITAFLQLSALNAMLPVLQHFLDAPQISPWQGYVLLTQLAGQLCTFGVGVDPASLPKFSHTDLSATYRLLFERLTQLLSASVMKRYVALNLKLYPNGVMLAEFDDPRLVSCQTFVLTAKSDKDETTPEKLAIDLPKLTKIGSKTTIRGIVQAASNGVPIQVAHRVPPEVPIRDGTVYFSVDVKHGAWKAVLNEHNVAVFIPPPYNPGKIRYELLAIPSEE
jgi:type VI secretion system protein ImpJ